MKVIDGIWRTPVRVAFGRGAGGGAGGVAPPAPQNFASRAEVVATVIDDPFLTHVATAGYGAPGDGGGALYTRATAEPGHPGKVRSADGAWWELVPPDLGHRPEQLGAVGNASTNDAAALTSWLGFDVLHLPRKTFVTDTALVASATARLVRGDGAGRGVSLAYDGAIIETPSNTAIVDLLTITAPSMVQQVTLSDFGLKHQGSGTALKIDDVIRTHISRLHINCNQDAAHGLEFTNSAYFAHVIECNIQNFTEYGIVIDGAGSQHIVRNCHIAATNETAIAGVVVRNADFLIDGGQYNVNRADNTGIGILVENTGAGEIEGGRILDILSERDIGVKIDGITAAFNKVEIVRPFFNLKIQHKGVVFGRAKDCVLRNPLVRVSAAPIDCLVEWEANSVRCGIECDADTARAPLTVDPAATDPWMRVTGFTSTSQFNAIDAAAHPDTLTIYIDHVEDRGSARRLDGAWYFELPWRDLQTISGGAIPAPTSNHLLVLPEGGVADILDTVTGGMQGQYLTLTLNSSTPVTIRHGTGNLRLAGGADFIMDDSNDTITFLRKNAADWIEVARSSNS